MPLIALLAVVVLVALAQVPVARRLGSSPALAVRVSTPRGAAGTLLLANLIIMAVTIGSAFALTTTGIGILFPAVLGPSLSFMAWAVIARVMPQQGARRWAIALAGMTPYLALALAATYWSSTIDSLTAPGVDTFMAGLAAFILTVIGLGAFVAGLLTVTFTKQKR